MKESDYQPLTPEQQQSIKGKSAILEVPSLLVVEVVSADSVSPALKTGFPSQGTGEPERVKRDYKKKPLEYAAFKIPEYWIVDPIKNKVTVHVLIDNQYETSVFTGNQQIVSDTFCELTLTVERLLAA
ncbi:hypothetical protein WA1_05980 [Scytonema hofmannii PCC 7110]|uniref:Putative restriction endonuclease domain-containing protein n=1 Tax=Scytonema hofmannii PCC 7110 TaxID=128403 RepID=A0A139WSG1_9CYAN|nr:Uma2 family endonuclease [Scytonema hofmannii]KYC35372.1 hypothetical protein WA1_05980 [Scytonema hofmannii PCC 7110]